MWITRFPLLRTFGTLSASQRARLILGAVQLVALALVSRGDFPPSGFPLDDAWIHQVVARTFAQTGTLGFEPGHHGAGATSFAWAALLAVNHAFIGMSPPLFACILGALFYFASGQLLLVLLLADGIPVTRALVFASLFHLSGNYVWFTVSGMEAPLSVFLALLALWLWCAGKPRPLATGFVVACLAWTRPEALVLAPLLVVARRPESLRRAAELALPITAGVVLYAWVNAANTGSILPRTLEGRRWLWVSLYDGLSKIDLARVFLLRWTDRLAGFTLTLPWGITFWIAMGLALIGARTAVQRKWRLLTICLAWTLLQVVVYAIIMPSEGNAGRYQPLVPGMFVVMVGIGMITLFDELVAVSQRPRLAPYAVAFCVLVIAAPAMLGLWRWGDYHALSVRHANRTEAAMGKIVGRLPPDAKVASFDIGGIGYFSNRRIADLSGLLDPSLIPLVREGRIGEYIKREHLDYLVLAMTYPPAAPDYANFLERLGIANAPDLKLAVVDSVMTPPERWWMPVMATMCCTPAQVLYRVGWANP
jgi:hypothetical protein